jgi:hypothetical protein
MAYADAVNYNRIKSLKGYPVGSIIVWSGEQDTIPTGWIPCSGNTISAERYPLLYKTIGNVYGGTIDVSFRLPPLNSGDVAAVDIFQGHFNYLQTQGDANKPENTIRANDEFWKTVGGADNGNRPSTTQVNWISTIDIVGEHITRPDVVARHDAFALSEGDVSITVNTNERKLSDVHIPPHSHNNSDVDSPSYTRDTSRRARQWANRFGTLSDFFGGDTFSRCELAGVRANATRSLNDPPRDGREMAIVGTSRLISTTYRQGGGNIINDGVTNPNPDCVSDTGPYAASGFSNGDGYSRGDLFSHRTGQKYFWSGLASEFTNFSQVAPHAHGTLEYNWVSRIRIINPGIVNDVKMNTVQINNSTGANFGTINMSAATANLTMIFVIKAF